MEPEIYLSDKQIMKAGLSGIKTIGTKVKLTCTGEVCMIGGDDGEPESMRIEIDDIQATTAMGMDEISSKLMSSDE